MKIQQAYKVLGNTLSRCEYDEQLLNKQDLKKAEAKKDKEARELEKALDIREEERYQIYWRYTVEMMMEILLEILSELVADTMKLKILWKDCQQ
jgi:hypothetical protein